MSLLIFFNISDQHKQSLYGQMGEVNCCGHYSKLDAREIRVCEIG